MANNRREKKKKEFQYNYINESNTFTLQNKLTLLTNYTYALL